MLKNPLYQYGASDLQLPMRLNFGEFMLNKFVHFKEKRIINGLTEETITYGDVAQGSMNLAISLSRLGVRKGQIVAICSENRTEFWVAVMGSICTGATFTTFNMMYTNHELTHVAGISKPKYVFCSPLAYKMHGETFKSLKYMEKIIVFGDETPPDAVSFNSLVSAQQVKYEDFTVVDVDGPDDSLFVLYSSGTTGLPKGVVLTHKNVLISTSAPSIPTRMSTTYLMMANPWFHTSGLMGGLFYLANGYNLVYLPKFEPELYLKCIEKYKITRLVVVPQMLVALVKYPSKHDLSSVELLYSGAAPLTKETTEAVKAKFPGINKVLQVYGMTEVTLAVTTDQDDSPVPKVGSVGRVMPGAIIKVVDLKTKKPVGANQTGEICVKGGLVMKGYVGKDRRDDFDDEEFFKTGDVGYYDEDGYFFILDRLQELIKYKAYQVAPAEIEAVLLQHPAVRDAGVVGVSDSAVGEVPRAFVVVQPGVQVTPKELQQFVAERINGLTEETITYGDVAQCSMNLAISLSRLGVRKGQTAGICSENRTEFWVAVMGSICTGATFTTFNMMHKNDELTHVAGISKPQYVFCSPLAYKMHGETFKSLNYIEKIIVFGDETPPDAVSFNSLVSAQQVKYEDFTVVDVDGPDDSLFVLYSSGTTGLPKGVVLTHKNVLISTSPTSIQTPPMFLMANPWFHTSGLMGGLVYLANGYNLVYLPNFETELYLKCIEKYKITRLAVVPSMLVALLKCPSKHDLGSVELVYSGAAPLTMETTEAVKAKYVSLRLPSINKVLQLYGMTEVTLAVTAESAVPKMGSVGRVVPGAIIKVVELKTKKPVGPNQTGEICVKGGIVMKGYVGKDRRDDFDDEGFFRTGDVGYYDEDGYFFIVDRLKELIKYKEYQVGPAEIEAVLLQHPVVRDAGVVGVSDSAAGEVPRAFVVVQPGVQVTPKELQQFVAERLSNEKHLRGGVYFVDEIPKTPSGKILRRQLRSCACAEEE